MRTIFSDLGRNQVLPGPFPWTNNCRFSTNKQMLVKNHVEETLVGQRRVHYAVLRLGTIQITKLKTPNISR